ncbi:Gamma-soluble nsf attachment protein [Operophtera brumata]|uniref:Gamma-soluble nsf attachment protein n=1 Tax=Operophtera brumata TaxID=104452 RepID=A0A0L7KYM4_OPEBR|nr:Gamma-soluble nsf attachment protein [Operophtera brumata]
MECHLKASENYKLNHSFFHAAKALENAIVIYGFACDAACLYQQHGSGDSGAAVLGKAARILEEAHPEHACKLFQQAAEASFEWASNCEQAEQNTVEMLLQGMDENDSELVKRALGAPFIRSMDVEYARLAATIPLPQGDRDALTGPGVRLGAEQPYVSGQAAAADQRFEDIQEDPYESVVIPGRSDLGGLC